MPISYSKKTYETGSYPEAIFYWDYIVYLNDTVLGSIRATSTFMNISFILENKQFYVKPELKYFTVMQYHVYNNELVIGTIKVPAWLHKRLTIDIYGQGSWHFKRSEILSEKSESKNHFQPTLYLEEIESYPILGILFVILLELSWWQN